MFPPKYDDIDIPGLHASCLYMHHLLAREIQLVGKENVVLWGSRQGAAVALSTLLTWDGDAFAAVVGMGEWLPYEDQVWDFANGDDSSIRDDEWWGDTYWQKEHEDEPDFDWPTKVVKYFRFEIFLQERKGEVFKHIPAFLGRGKKDKIAELGTRTKKCLDIVEANAQMKEYDASSSVHGYSQKMLDDTFSFLQDKLGERREI
jgi:predicted esterase